MALIDRSQSAATVAAAIEMWCFVMTQWNFRPFATEHPDVAWALLEAMVQRVREAESRIPSGGDVCGGPDARSNRAHGRSPSMVGPPNWTDRLAI